MRYIWGSAIRRLISLYYFPTPAMENADRRKKFLKVGVNQPLYHCNRPNSFLIKYCQHICAIVLNRKEGRPSSFLFLRILRREIGYNFLETWVAAQRIPARVQFQITIA